MNNENTPPPVTETRNTIPLPGCTPEPLANYLKALGVIRSLSEQAPQWGVRAAWEDDILVLHGLSNTTDLAEFFLHTYRPSAIVAPWNGGSGFHPKDNKAAIAAIQQSTSERFATYREVIKSSEAALNELGLREKPYSDLKEKLLEQCRNLFPDEALGWLDAAYVLTSGGVRYPPLLGTGGNDGRLDFTNNFMQRLNDVLDMETGRARDEAKPLLRNALLGDVVRGLAENAIGQFGPAAAGGANASSGFTSKSLVNPWDFVLMLEGTVLFAAASVKRLESSHNGQLAYPFSARTTGVGYASAAGADQADSRCEMWMPLWGTPASYREVQSFLSEGRAQIGRRPARDGLDFYRAITSLGVDRGIDAFQRYGFLVRNGLAYFATPMDRVPVRLNAEASDLLSDLDRNSWLEHFRQKANSANAPGSVAHSCRRLERAVIGLCTASQTPEQAALQVRELLVALGYCELAMARSLPWTQDNRLSPVPPLAPRWLSAGAKMDDSGGVEYRLAAALASLTLGGYFGEHSHSFRTHLEPVEWGGYAANHWVRWAALETRDVVSLDGRLPERLNAIIHRRLLLCQKSGDRSWQEFAGVSAHLSDVAAFIEGDCDDQLLRDLAVGLSLIDWASPELAGNRPRPPGNTLNPGAFFALVKLCHQQTKSENTATHSPSVPLDPGIHRLTAAGQPERAADLAIRRLRSAGFGIGLPALTGWSGETERAAAALLFPLWQDQIRQLGNILHVRPPDEPESDTHETTEPAESL